jgi:hypothetical protein
VADYRLTYMKNDAERNSVLFHDRASELMASLYREFKLASASIDRQWDENVFQQLQGKYTNQLKCLLERIALEMMEQQGDGQKAWSYALTGFIHDYVKEFEQKIKSL